MPKSATRTHSGSDSPASRFTTSTPKPSSWRKMLPIPATSIRCFISSISVSSQPRNLHSADFYIPNDVRHDFGQQVANRYQCYRAYQRCRSTLFVVCLPHVFLQAFPTTRTVRRQSLYYLAVHQRLDFIRRKIKKSPVPAVQVCCEIVFDRHRHVAISVNIAEHRFHCRKPPLEKHVLRIGAPLSGTKPNTAALRHGDSADL